MQHAGIRQKKTNLHSLLSVLGKGSEKSALNLYFSSEALPCRELAVWMISLENWIRHQSRGQQKPKHFVVSITSRYLQHDQMLKLRRKKKKRNKPTNTQSRSLWAVIKMWSQAETHDGASWYVATATVEQGGWWVGGTPGLKALMRLAKTHACIHRYTVAAKGDR